MDGKRFDELMAMLTRGAGSRRGVLSGLTADLLWTVKLGSGARAAPCKQDRRPCANGNECCSGLCRGRQGKKTCRPAPGQGTCTIKKDTCEIGGHAAACGEGCSCFLRPTGAAFCTDTLAFDCLPCRKCPAGTVCVRARNGLCVACPVGTGATQTICVRRCGANRQ